jgi:CIC family chloride channel protein
MAQQQPPVPPSSPALKVRRWLDELRRNENHLTLILSLLIGALVGLVVVAFILLTGRLAARMYPAGGSGWCRILVPTVGSLVTGYLHWRFFPSARGSGIPQTKAALFIQDGRIMFRAVVGKFLCCSASLATGMALGRSRREVHLGTRARNAVPTQIGLNFLRLSCEGRAFG